MTEPDPEIPLAMDDVRDLSDEEYEATYADGDGGHPLPPEILKELKGELP
jgi:hypothetical protein